MTDDEIIALLKKALAEVAPGRTADFDKITLEATIDDLDLDSISTMEMVGYLEEQVDALFPDEELAKVKKLADLAALMRGSRVNVA